MSNATNVIQKILDILAEWRGAWAGIQKFSPSDLLLAVILEKFDKVRWVLCLGCIAGYAGCATSSNDIRFSIETVRKYERRALQEWVPPVTRPRFYGSAKFWINNRPPEISVQFETINEMGLITPWVFTFRNSSNHVDDLGADWPLHTMGTGITRQGLPPTKGPYRDYIESLKRRGE
jgi:hypothetical protein